MRADESRDAGALLGTALGEVAELTRGVHRAVADRVFGVLGSAAAPVRAVHDGLADVAYGCTQLGLWALPTALGAAAGALGGPTTGSWHDDPRGRVVLNAVNGLWGDRMATRQVALAPVMRLRTHSGALRRLPENLCHDAQATATGRVVVFVHGLCESDLSWSWGAQKHWGAPAVTYGGLLQRDDGWTPLYVSYNSGLHVSANGAQLADLLAQVVSGWPTPVTELALVGHSMGGLVAHSAATQAAAASLPWVEVLRHVVGLGAPHLGAPLERAVSSGTHWLRRLPETRPLATWLNRRSVGIKDLRHGALVAGDWFGFDPDEVGEDRCTSALFLPGVGYHAVSATLSREADGRFAHDLMVQHASATGAGPVRRLPFSPDQAFHVGGRHHFDLLGDPQVYQQLRRWLAADAH